MPTATKQFVEITEAAFYDTPQAGELEGVTEATQLPDRSCKLVMFKALETNTGNVYLGDATVTTPTGSTNTTTGYELTPGESTGWIPIDNLNRLYRICDGVNDDLSYLLLK